MPRPPQPQPPASSEFPDHFSGHASDYARYRPDYPPALFDYLAELSPRRRLAWDCATGSGQAAVPLASRFERVIATDASARQVDEAAPHPRVLYAVATAESAPLPDGSVDLVTVAQALHWFDRDRFWVEARRVLVPQGVVAFWNYDLFHSTAEIDHVVREFYFDVVGPYWPAERALVERGYRELEFPFEDIEIEIGVDPPPFSMEKHWTLPELSGYIRTWSATRRYLAARGQDPLSRIEKPLAEAWGDPASPRTIHWELDLRVGRHRSATTIGP